ncbi:hypothetical protein [Microvirga lotononidis]|uniref:Uncharacterized protein n=1 Tax=Microvirga lotononidis TaxID=864069 RepID=I4Z142_9HYPH|nr:hypothetical protein [Microvirga lotononidis]EIM29934.1 hypothetical protein MicloDRAFT_00012550 [Microvirga lotononidis]WQO32004.1 hypothetical protein U0023_32260 [Microvirga lotononidis]
MSDAKLTQQSEALEHCGYQIRLIQSGSEWMAFVARPKQRPTLIMAPDREAVTAKAKEWIAAQLTSTNDR